MTQLGFQVNMCFLTSPSLTHNYSTISLPLPIIIIRNQISTVGGPLEAVDGMGCEAAGYVEDFNGDEVGLFGYAVCFAGDDGDVTGIC
jgi:hypothetical protein